jgi:hypothetical protein
MTSQEHQRFLFPHWLVLHSPPTYYLPFASLPKRSFFGLAFDPVKSSPQLCLSSFVQIWQRPLPLHVEFASSLLLRTE